MNLPAFLKLKFPSGTGNFGLWIPMVLVYLVLALITLLFLPLVLVLSLILLPFRTRRVLIYAPYYFWILILNLRGLQIHVVDGDREIRANFI